MQDSQSDFASWLGEANALAWTGFMIGLFQVPATYCWLRDFTREWVYDLQRANELREQGKALRGGLGIATVPQEGPFTNWSSGEPEARVTTVVSGKGGVGKSCIALGLLEYYSMSGNVLLVDLDLHNRGLTSIFESSKTIGATSRDTTFSELERFKQAILPMARIGLPASSDAKTAYSSIDEESWRAMVEAHTREKRGKQRWIRPMRCVELPGRPEMDRRFYNGTVGAGRCHFMSARSRDERLFLSEVSHLDYIEVFLFVKSIAAWARVCDQDISNVIIDCHGAQDMFSVGALLAANHVVVVANEDPGSFEGTAELASIVRDLVDEDRYLPASLSFVLNQSRRSKRWVRNDSSDPADRDAYDRMLGTVSSAPPGDVSAQASTKSVSQRIRRVTVRHDDDIRRRIQSYRFPCVKGLGSLWQEMSRIAAPAVAGADPGLLPSAGSSRKSPTTDPHPGADPASGDGAESSQSA